jgi:hypothetical protein
MPTSGTFVRLERVSIFDYYSQSAPGTVFPHCGKKSNRGQRSKHTPCFTPMGVYKKLATLNPENIPVNVISVDIL